MRLNSELLLTLGALMALNLLLAFGAIALFARMGPAIEEILDENVASISTVEEILSELAVLQGEPATSDSRRRLDDALGRAERNITEPAERPILVALREDWSGALEGDAPARKRVVKRTRVLSQINRDAMLRADTQARQYGNAGAWAAVLIGFITFLFGLLALGRMQRRWVRPLVEVHDVLMSARAGERHRRCRPCDAPNEVVAVAQSVNLILDERLSKGD